MLTAECTCMYCFYLLVIWITVHITCIIVSCYPCIPIIWLLPVTDLDLSVTGHESYWYAMCGTKCHVDPSHGAISRIPHLLFPVSRYLVLCYQPSSGPVIMLHVPCTVFVLATLCTLNIRNITWGWGRLDGWLDLIGWMYWIHIVSPTAGDGSAADRLYSSMSSRYLIRAPLLAEGPGLSSQGSV